MRSDILLEEKQKSEERLYNDEDGGTDTRSFGSSLQGFEGGVRESGIEKKEEEEEEEDLMLLGDMQVFYCLF